MRSGALRGHTRTNKKQSSCNPPRGEKNEKAFWKHRRSIHNRYGLKRSLREGSRTTNATEVKSRKVHFDSQTVTLCGNELLGVYHLRFIILQVCLLISEKYKVKRDKHEE